jgi:hypothetical protein
VSFARTRWELRGHKKLWSRDRNDRLTVGWLVEVRWRRACTHSRVGQSLFSVGDTSLRWACVVR